MRYINISDQPRRVVRHRVKTLVRPGGVINLGTADINHSSSALRFFEPYVEKEDKMPNEKVENEKLNEIEAGKMENEKSDEIEAGKEESETVVESDEQIENIQSEDVPDSEGTVEHPESENLEESPGESEEGEKSEETESVNKEE